MLRLSPRRALSKPSLGGARVGHGSQLQIRWVGNGNGDGGGGGGRERKSSERVNRSPRTPADRGGDTNNKASRHGRHHVDAAENDKKKKEKKKPSLIEQLFPEQAKRDDEARRPAPRDVPRLPLDDLRPTRELGHVRPVLVGDDHVFEGSPEAQRKFEQMRRQSRDKREVTVLVMRNASRNLTDDDFRRLIPQSRHMEGWALDRADIIKVVPGRNMATLAQESYYYLLFSSQLAAFLYQGHVTRVFRTVATQTPSSVTSPIPPPPGYMIDGMDAHAAIETFSLIPPSQRLELRQLNSPLAPAMASLVRHQGYAALVNRADKSPFECRLTLDGPQLSPSHLRHIFLMTGQGIGVTWSGGDALVPRITRWDPLARLVSYQPSPTDPGSPRALEALRKQAEANQQGPEAAAEMARRRRHKRDAQRKGHGAPGAENQLVFILGFETASAAQRFVAFWHRREMVAQDYEGRCIARYEPDDDDAPPIANVEILW
ncbi:hypothetical protein Tdes44962_MAKER09656 [Teratosphaeria destructans]|uniref:Uncharacterized protein n=1 Tax=Teratosphaeria destructans TaxID=418781 RepID=A0A9W7SSB6_9PEZI|nr:hypothetical protein Tdes44962_MAKER09656 [Teratosphaeria destructans]